MNWVVASLVQFEPKVIFLTCCHRINQVNYIAITRDTKTNYNLVGFLFYYPFFMRN